MMFDFDDTLLPDSTSALLQEHGLDPTEFWKGTSLDDRWFSGLPQFFDDLRSQVAQYRDVSIEFYIISGGLQSVIEGSRHVQKHFSGAYGCQLGEDAETGRVSTIKRCVTFTEKTRFVFEINKGIPPADAATQPHLVNQSVAAVERRVPFRRMIYVGDGYTDIPCFSLIEKEGIFVRSIRVRQDVGKASVSTVLADPARSKHAPPGVRTGCRTRFDSSSCS